MKESHHLEQMSNLWAKQLHLEFEDICWQYNIKLTAPIIDISNSKKTYGAWHAATRTIYISSILIKNHSWSVTLNVLRHEICHQICSELFNRDNEVAHGQAFHAACDLIGLPPKYRNATGDLPDDGIIDSSHQPHSEGRRFIDKIEKLLALAESANENEAAFAMQKANELIEKYNIKQLHTGLDIQYTHAIINRKRKRIESYQRQICAILRDFFYVKIVCSSLYDPLLDQSHKTIEILGSTENVTIAEYCYYFLENQLSSLWSKNKHRYRGNTRTEKNSYYLGLLKGFKEKLQQQKKSAWNENGKPFPDNSKKTPTPPKMASLVLAEDLRLNEYLQTRFPRLSTRSLAGPRVIKATYGDGVTTGKRITFHKGIAKTDGNKGKLLPNTSK